MNIKSFKILFELFSYLVKRLLILLDLTKKFSLILFACATIMYIEFNNRLCNKITLKNNNKKYYIQNLNVAKLESILLSL